MKKIVAIFFFLIAGVAVAGTLAWVYRVEVAVHMLSDQLGVPVKIHTLEIYSQGADLLQVWVGNPPDSRSQTAFSAASIHVQTPVFQILADPLIIDEIIINDIFIGVEYYNKKKSQSNWATILEEKSSQKPSRDYLIRTLRFNRMTVDVMQANGTKKSYTLPEMEFHNISSATGFPVGEIEKAIFQQVLQGLIQQLNLNQIFNGVIPMPKGIPLPWNLSQ